MTKLLWLCVAALGHRMLFEMSYDLRPRWGRRLRNTLKWLSWVWVIYLVATAVWWLRTYGP